MYDNKYKDVQITNALFNEGMTGRTRSELWLFDEDNKILYYMTAKGKIEICVNQ